MPSSTPLTDDEEGGREGKEPSTKAFLKLEHRGFKEGILQLKAANPSYFENSQRKVVAWTTLVMWSF